MSFPCPKCGERHTQKLSTMVDAGTREHIGYYGDVRINRNLLAAKYAPPRYQTPIKFTPVYRFFRGFQMGFVAALIIAFPIGMQLEHHGVSTGKLGLGIIPVLLFGGAIGAVLSVKWGKRKNAALYKASGVAEALQVWEQQFICFGCENIFIPR